MALDIYKLTSQLPEEEEFGLILRMRKAACDVPANIANGFERRQLTAKLALYREARAAVEELRYYFILCRDLGYPIEFEKFSQGGEQLARMVGGLVGSIARVESGHDRRGVGRGGDRLNRGIHDAERARLGRAGGVRPGHADQRLVREHHRALGEARDLLARGVGLALGRGEQHQHAGQPSVCCLGARPWPVEQT